MTIESGAVLCGLADLTFEEPALRRDHRFCLVSACANEQSEPKQSEKKK